MATRKKIEAIHPKFFAAEVKKIAKKYGKVVIVFNDDCNDLRRRMVLEDGNCKVSYKGHSYRKWSRYVNSCFMEYTEDEYSYGRYDRHHNWIEEKKIRKKGKKRTLENTIKALQKHDKECGVFPVEIRYGNKLGKVLIVQQRYF